MQRSTLPFEENPVFGYDPRIESILTEIEGLGKSNAGIDARKKKFIGDLNSLESKVSKTGNLSHVLKVRNERTAWEGGNPTESMNPKDESPILNLRKLRFYIDRYLKDKAKENALKTSAQRAVLAAELKV